MAYNKARKISDKIAFFWQVQKGLRIYCIEVKSFKGIEIIPIDLMKDEEIIDKNLKKIKKIKV